MAVSTRLHTWRQSHPALAPGLVLAVVVSGLVYAYFANPYEPGHYPVAWFRELTGLYCPGCGTARALHELTHGNIIRALDLNALTVVLLLPMLGHMWLRWLLVDLGKARCKLAHPAWLWAFFVVVLVFSVVRNLPFPLGHLLAP